ncbi:MAG: hypothetical protein OEZ06_23435 [Myxococcales bacterium]|nr:hypothetical protein [Myxococcales bacterium]
MRKSPIQTVKERFNDKASLVAAVQSLISDDLWLDRVNSEKGLGLISNRKLLHLHEVLSAVKERFGSREKLIEAIAEGAKRAKDADYKKSLERFPTPRLYELYRAGVKRAKAAAN